MQMLSQLSYRPSGRRSVAHPHPPLGWAEPLRPLRSPRAASAGRRRAPDRDRARSGSLGRRHDRGGHAGVLQGRHEPVVTGSDRSRAADLWLVRPSRALLIASVVATIVVAVGSLALGTLLAGPFFGTVELHLGDPRSLVPALGLALANTSMEEIAYRGAMLCVVGGR